MTRIRLTILPAALAVAIGCSLPPTVVRGRAGNQEGDAAPEDHGYTLIDDMEGSGELNRGKWTSLDGSQTVYWAARGGDCSEEVAPVVPLEPQPWSFSSLPEPHVTFPAITSTRAVRLRTAEPLLNTWGAAMVLTFASVSAEAGSVGLPAEAGSVGLREASTALAEASPFGEGGASGALDDGEGTASPEGGTAPLVSPFCPISYPTVDAPVDLTGYRGLTFWAKGGDGAKTLLVQVKDAQVNPQFSTCWGDADEVNDCDNGFGIRLTLTNELTRYTVLFSSLAQNLSWGYRSTPPTLDLEHVSTLVFEIDTPGGACPPQGPCAGGTPTLTFDLWIDDLYFINE